MSALPLKADTKRDISTLIHFTPCSIRKLHQEEGLAPSPTDFSKKARWFPGNGDVANDNGKRSG